MLGERYSVVGFTAHIKETRGEKILSLSTLSAVRVRSNGEPGASDGVGCERQTISCLVCVFMNSDVCPPPRYTSGRGNHTLDQEVWASPIQVEDWGKLESMNPGSSTHIATKSPLYSDCSPLKRLQPVGFPPATVHIE